MTIAVVLLSGGLDSTVALHRAIRTYGREHVEALSLEYGQRHGIEVVCAVGIAAFARVRLETHRIDLPWESSLAGSIVIDGPLAGRSAVVPARNTILASIAAGYALSRGASRVWIGCCAADAEAFADCRPEWIAAMSRVLELGVDPELALVAPYVDRTKAQIVREARELGAECWRAVAHSWSCYAPTVVHGATTPCSRCGACVARARGFEEAGEHDPALPVPT